jgi:rhodanese-related sulfurtransferase
MAGYKEIESTDLHSLMSQGKVLLVDVRTNDETSRGLIQGARLIPLHLLPMHADELDADVPLIFYCHSGMRSAQASQFMANKGRDDVYNLRGGILAWSAAGYPIESKR